MFSDLEDPVSIANAMDSYKAALGESLANPTPGHPHTRTLAPAETESSALQKAMADGGVLSKSLSPELLSSVQNALAQSDIGKEWTLGTGSNGNPVPTGLVAFDLEAPAKLLAPRPTPLRNRIPRRKGVGQAHRFKRITGFTGSGTGGVGVIRPGIAENAQNQWNAPNGPYWMRGAMISYAGDDQSVVYKQFGLSDQVSWAAQFAGVGFQDVRQTSQNAVLWASMLTEERLLLGGRSTDSGMSGALAAPTGVALAVRAATGAEVGNTANIANLFVYVTAISVYGESVASTVVSTTGMSAATGDVVDVTFNDVAGALGYRIYAGTTTGIANVFIAQISGSAFASAPGAIPATGTGSPAAGTSANKLTINFTGGGTGGAPNSGAQPPAADTSASSLDYDGILSYCTGSNAGYVNRINSTLSTSNPGDEFNQAFASLYDSVKADPDEILANGHDRKQLSDALKSASNSNYRITLANDGDAHGATIGALVTGIQNEVTGKPSVDITVHPWLPQGNMPIISWTLPLPDSQVSDVFSVFNVTDYTAISWPQMQYSYDMSSYWFGTMVCYAPAWCGAVQGIYKK